VVYTKVFFLVEYCYYPNIKQVYESSSCQVRVKPLSSELENRGWECKIIEKPSAKSFNPIQRYVLPFSFFEVLHEATRVRQYNVLFVSRAPYFGPYILQKLWETYGGKVVFDFDDALFLERIARIGLFQKIIAKSSVITVSSHYLLSYAKNYNPNVFIVHTPIDTELFTPSLRKDHDKITIGWMGNTTGHLKNLEILRPILIKLGHKYDLRFKIVSAAGDLRVRNLFKEVEKYVDLDYGLNHFVPFRELPELVSDFDIGVSPLINEPWFEAKSAIKSAMYMATGLPTVASKIGEQKYVIDQGVNGFLVETESEWFEYLSALIEDGRLRKKMGMEARKKAEQELSVKACGNRLFRILESL
jgi:glycosyltransferase involved in cell wall biosynthesis